MPRAARRQQQQAASGEGVGELSCLADELRTRGDAPPIRYRMQDAATPCDERRNHPEPAGRVRVHTLYQIIETQPWESRAGHQTSDTQQDRLVRFWCAITYMVQEAGMAQLLSPFPALLPAGPGPRAAKREHPVRRACSRAFCLIAPMLLPPAFAHCLFLICAPWRGCRRASGTWGTCGCPS